MVTSAKTSFHWEKILLEVNTGRGLLIPSGDQLEEQVCALNIYGKVVNLVNNEHPLLG